MVAFARINRVPKRLVALGSAALMAGMALGLYVLFVRHSLRVVDAVINPIEHMRVFAGGSDSRGISSILAESLVKLIGSVTRWPIRRCAQWSWPPWPGSDCCCVEGICGRHCCQPCWSAWRWRSKSCLAFVEFRPGILSIWSRGYWQRCWHRWISCIDRRPWTHDGPRRKHRAACLDRHPSLGPRCGAGAADRKCLRPSRHLFGSRTSHTFWPDRLP